MFVAEHRADWTRLEQLTRRRRTLSGTEADELVDLYQRTAAQLSALQSAGLDAALTARLSASAPCRSSAAVSSPARRSTFQMDCFKT